MKYSNTKSGFLYLIHNGSSEYKIGYSKNPRKRLKELQTAQKDVLSLIAFIPVVDMIKAERAAHDLLAAYRARGEWFVFNLKGYQLLYKIFKMLPVTADEEQSLLNLGLRDG